MERDEHQKHLLGSENCQQCQSEDTVDVNEFSREPTALVETGKVINLEEYLSRRVMLIEDAVSRVEARKSTFMKQLIRERDHSIARRLQREINNLDEHDTRLKKLLQSAQDRYDRYTEYL